MASNEQSLANGYLHRVLADSVGGRLPAADGNNRIAPVLSMPPTGFVYAPQGVIDPYPRGDVVDELASAPQPVLVGDQPLPRNAPATRVGLVPERDVALSIEPFASGPVASTPVQTGVAPEHRAVIDQPAQVAMSVAPAAREWPIPTGTATTHPAGSAALAITPSLSAPDLFVEHTTQPPAVLAQMTVDIPGASAPQSTLLPPGNRSEPPKSIVTVPARQSGGQPTSRRDAMRTAPALPSAGAALTAPQVENVNPSLVPPHQRHAVQPDERPQTGAKRESYTVIAPREQAVPAALPAPVATGNLRAVKPAVATEIAQLRQTTQELAAKLAAQEATYRNLKRTVQQPAAQPPVMQPIVVMQQRAGTTNAPRAFWARSYLRRSGLGVRR
ncbi:MAG: hypothetical protein R3E79_10825 [Caldilineaceae bacterium]